MNASTDRKPVQSVRFELAGAGIEAVPPSFRREALATYRRLEKFLGPLHRPLVIRIGGADSLRFAYRPSEDCVIVPASSSLAPTLTDWDRLHHEMFHAYLGALRPELFAPIARAKRGVEALHEGLADFFAATCDNNDVFGDVTGHHNPPPTRSYLTTWDYALVRGSHARGNVITSFLLEQSYSLAELGEFCRAGPFTLSRLIPPKHHPRFSLGKSPKPRVAIGITGQPRSRLNRLRVVDDCELTVTTNEALRERYGEDVEITFATEHGDSPQCFTFAPGVTSTGRSTYGLTPTTRPAYEKLLVRFFANGTEIGFEPVYLRAAAVR